MQISETQNGELLVVVKALVSSISPILIVFALSSVGPFASLAMSNFFAVLFFASLLTLKGKWQEVFKKSLFLDGLAAAVFIGLGLYGLYFYGLKFTTAGNASIIVLMEIFFSYLFFNVWKKEDFSKTHALGALLMVVGALLVLFPKSNTTSFNTGDLLILCAVAFGPMGNYFQQKLRKKVSTDSALFIRYLLSLPLVCLLAIIFKEMPSAESLLKSLPYLLIFGLVMLGANNILWLEAIHRISVTKAISLVSLSPFFTLLFAYFLLKEVPGPWQLLSLVPLGLGVRLLTKKNPTTMVE